MCALCLCLCLKRLLQTHGPYTVTNNIKKHCVNTVNKINMLIFQHHREIDDIEIE